MLHLFGKLSLDICVYNASDATIAMELGCDGVLVNTALAEAKTIAESAEARAAIAEATAAMAQARAVLVKVITLKIQEPSPLEALLENAIAPIYIQAA